MFNLNIFISTQEIVINITVSFLLMISSSFFNLIIDAETQI